MVALNDIHKDVDLCFFGLTSVHDLARLTRWRQTTLRSRAIVDLNKLLLSVCRQSLVAISSTACFFSLHFRRTAVEIRDSDDYHENQSRLDVHKKQIVNNTVPLSLRSLILPLKAH